MTDIIAAITSVFTSAIGWVGTVASTIADEPMKYKSAVLVLIIKQVATPAI